MKKNLLFLIVAVFMNCGLIAQKTVKDPTDPAYKSGKQKYDAKNYQSAWHDFNLLVQKNKAESDKYLKKKKEYDALSEYEKALVDNAELMLRRTDLSLPLYYRGMCYLKTGEKNKAKFDFEAAVELDDYLGDAFCELGKMLLENEKTKDQACVFLRKGADNGSEEAKELYAVQFCWNYSINYEREGTVKMNLAKYESAITDFTLAIKLNPDSGNYFYKRGMCYYELKKYEKAIEDFSKAIEKEKRASFYFARGKTYYSIEKHKQAFDDFTGAINIDGKNAEMYMYRAYSCEGIGNPKSAIFDYGEAIRLNPENGEAYYKRALLKQDLKDKTCCKDFKKAADLGVEEAADFAKTCK